MDTSALLRNCMRVEKDGGELLAMRFSPKMLEHYDRAGEMTSVRAMCTAGATLDFVTEVDEIGFRYHCTRHCRPHITFDIFENDGLTTTLREPDNSTEGVVRYRRRIPGRGRVTIHLPYTADVRLADLELGAAEPVPAPEKTTLFLGDSITQGMTVMRPSQSYANVLARLLGTGVVNQGVGSYVFCADSLRDVRAVGASRIVVAYGTNDYTRVKNGDVRFDEFRRDMEEYMAALAGRTGGVPVHVVTPIWRSSGCQGADEEALMNRVRDAIATAALSRGFDVAGGFGLVGHEDAFLVDGLHPNDLGANMMAVNLYRHIMRA